MALAGVLTLRQQRQKARVQGCPDLHNKPLSQTLRSPFPEISTGLRLLEPYFKMLPECKDAPITNDERLTKEPSLRAGEHSTLYSAWQPWPQSTVVLRAELRSLHAHLRTYRSPGADTGTRRESPSSQDLGL